MSNAPHFNDPDHWRHRAEETRILAQQMSDETAKKLMLRIAGDCEPIGEPRVEGQLLSQIALPQSNSGATVGAAKQDT